jgi:hypothetical protein
LKDIIEVQGLFIVPLLVAISVLGILILTFTVDCPINEDMITSSSNSKHKKNKSKTVMNTSITKLESDTSIPNPNPNPIPNLQISTTEKPAIIFQSNIHESETKWTPLIIVLTLVFYFIIFHNLANLPLGDRLLFGVHQRLGLGLGLDLGSG